MGFWGNRPARPIRGQLGVEAGAIRGHLVVLWMIKIRRMAQREANTHPENLKERSQ